MLPEIIPTILTKSEEDLVLKIKILERLVDWVQIDVVDGLFTPGRTASLETLSQIETTLSLEIHLMVKDPFSWLRKCVQILASRVIAQIESMADQEDFIAQVIESGLEPGLALDFETEIEALNQKALAGSRTVLLMGYKAGFGGGDFHPRVFEKIKALKELKEKEGFLFKIMVDGGVNYDNAQELVKAGADELAVGGAIFASGNPGQAISKFEKILK